MTLAEFDRLPMLLRLAQVQAILGLHHQLIGDLVKQGKIRTVKLHDNGRRHYYKVDVAALAGLRKVLPSK